MPKKKKAQIGRRKKGFWKRKPCTDSKIKDSILHDHGCYTASATPVEPTDSSHTLQLDTEISYYDQYEDCVVQELQHPIEKEDPESCGELCDTEGHNAHEFIVVVDDTGYIYDHAVDPEEICVQIRSVQFESLHTEVLQDREKYESLDYVVSAKQENLLQFINLYHTEIPSVKSVVNIDRSFSAFVYVHRKLLSSEHGIWGSVPRIYRTSADVLKLLKRLLSFCVCVGNWEEKFAKCVPDDEMSTSGISAYRDSTNGAVLGDLEYSSTLRATGCTLLTNGVRCDPCRSLRASLRKKISREISMQERFNRAEINLLSWTKANSKMSPAELQMKVTSLRDHANSLQNENKQLRKKLSRCSDTQDDTCTQTPEESRDLVLQQVVIAQPYDECQQRLVLQQQLLYNEQTDDQDMSNMEGFQSQNTLVKKEPSDLPVPRKICAESTNDKNNHTISTGIDTVQDIVIKTEPIEVSLSMPIDETIQNVSHTDNCVKTEHETPIENSWPNLSANLQMFPKNSDNIGNTGCVASSENIASDEPMQYKVEDGVIYGLETAGAQKKTGSNLNTKKKKSEKKTEPPFFTKPYKCDVCGTSFAYSTTLERHKDIHKNDRKPFICCICKKRFQFLEHLTEHTKMHSSDVVVSVTCENCHQSFSKLTDGSESVAEASGSTYSCYVCNRMFAASYLLLSHFIFAHTIKNNDKNVCLRCPDCQKNHVILQGKENNADNDSQESRVSSNAQSKDVVYTCDTCHMKFASVDDLQAHEKFMHKIKQIYQCHICLKNYYTASTLENHLSGYHRQYPHTCTICRRSFGISSALEKHMEIHENIDSFEQISAE